MKRFYQTAGAAVAAMAMLTACTTTKLVTRWNDTEYKGPMLEKVLVVGVMKDDIKRRYYEDEFVKKITSGGRQAVTGVG